MSDSTPDAPPIPDHPPVDVRTATETQADAEHAASAQGLETHGAHTKHRFDFDAVNASHTMPYPAIEWWHGTPIAIFNLVEYADVNYGRLSTDPHFATATIDPANDQWADSYISKHTSYLDERTHQPQTFKTTHDNLAKAMTVAKDESLLGVFPRELSFINHQTFWSTIALVLMALVLLVFNRRKPDQYKPANRFQHMMEAIVLFVRNDIVRPNIHHHPDWWTPYFASFFLVILTCNLFGLVPIFATATGNIAVTVAFALTTAFLMLFMGLKENGPIMFWYRLVPVKWSWNPIAILLWLFLFVLELSQLVIRPAVLAVRLFVNMFAGHSVLLVFASLGFIIFAGDHNAHAMSTGLGVVGWVLTLGLYALELLVAFLQAYIFTLLSAVFIGLCAHPEH
ncbi:MAG: F0F1 ATP synthase subunit A [Planctomycetes bacterium]|nr:F0F1 ATP synthase subunit A [Planctomycetota bacterium]